MLQLQNVSKYYYTKGVVSSGFVKATLELNRGEFVAITGESGSGKSTLLNVLSGLDSYEEGVMYVEGEDTSTYSEVEWEKYRRKYVSNIFQTFNLVPSYTVFQNVELALLLNGCKRADNRAIVEDALRKVGLYEFRNQRAARLSGGQKQRVAIARALVRDTPIIVADEPTGNLDTKSAASVVELLSKVAQDKLLLVVTHNYEQVQDYVTRKITMHDGQIIEDIRLREPYLSKRFEGEYAVAPASGAKQPDAGLPLPARSTAAAAAKNESTGAIAGVYDDEMKKIGFAQTLRLGVRNAFNIPSKFLLLLAVFLFVCVATAGYFASNSAADEYSTDYRYNYYFSDLSANRIIIKKTDGSTITQADFAKLAEIEDVERVVKDDLFLDTTLYLVGEDISFDARVVSLDSFSGELDEGAMPQTSHQVVISVSEYEWLAYDSSIKMLLSDTFSVNDAYSSTGDLAGDIQVSGIVYNSGYDYVCTMYCSEEVIEELRANVNSSYSTMTVEIGTITNEAGRWDSALKPTPSSLVKKGEALIAAEYVAAFDDGEAIGKQMKVSASNLYYTGQQTFTITDTYTKEDFEKKTGISVDEYEYRYGAIYINDEDYAAFFDSEAYQSSVFATSEETVDEVSAALQKLGYTTLCVKDISINMMEILEKIESFLGSFRTIVILIAIFFVSYFVIRLIMKSRNSYFTTVRILGATKKDCKRLIYIDLLTVLSVAYAALMLLVVLQATGIIHLGFLASYASYFTIGRAVVLFAVLCIMCLLQANRYSRKLFKKSAMKTYKEA